MICSCNVLCQNNIIDHLTLLLSHMFYSAFKSILKIICTCYTEVLQVENVAVLNLETTVVFIAAARCCCRRERAKLCLLGTRNVSGLSLSGPFPVGLHGSCIPIIWRVQKKKTLIEVGSTELCKNGPRITLKMFFRPFKNTLQGGPTELNSGNWSILCAVW